MVTVSTLLTLIRDRLDEPTAAQWTDDMLGRWINEGAKDLARSTRYLKGEATVAVTAGTGRYNLAATTIAVEHAYWTPTGDTRKMPLEPAHWESMDAVWGQWQNMTSAYPNFYTTMGFSPQAIIQIYPIPDVNGTLTLIVSKLWTEIAIPVVGAATADVPELWYDAITDYVEMMALRRDRDPRWQESQAMYTAKRDGLIQNADFLTQNREVVPAPGTATGYLPQWLVDPYYY